MNFTEGVWRSLIDNEEVRTSRLGGASSADTDQLNTDIKQPFDSVVYEIQTPIEGLSDGDPVEIWPASVGSPDGEGTELTYSEGAFDGIDAVSGDGDGGFGTDDPVLNIGSDSANVVFSSTFSWVMTIQSNNDEWGMGYISGSADDNVRMEYEENTLEFSVAGRDSDTNLAETSIFADIELDDGAARTIVWNRTSADDGSGFGNNEWEIWAGEQGGEISELETEIDGGFEDSVSDDIPEDDMTLFSESFSDALDGSISLFALADETLSADTIELFHEIAFS